MTDLSEPRDVEEGCGFTWDHDTVETYRGPDGIGWECRECGVEGWKPAEGQEEPAPS